MDIGYILLHERYYKSIKIFIYSSLERCIQILKYQYNLHQKRVLSYNPACKCTLSVKNERKC